MEKRNIRCRIGAFETNSSSSHSITVAKGCYVPDTLPITQEGLERVCSIYPGEFGWGYELHTRAVDKAAYCLTWLKTVEGVAEETLLAYDQMFKEVIRQATEATIVRYVPGVDEYTDGQSWGYIDHQSIERGERSVGGRAFKSKKNLRDFIFNRASELIIDNDNH